LGPLYTILSIIGSLGVFLFGMKLMSEALQKVAGTRLRAVLSASTSNKLKSILTGLLTTTALQSSSAITVMLVSFANAGLISVVESTGVVMGANIGTTVTAWIITLLGLGKSFSINHVLLPLIAISLPLLFSQNYKLKSWAEFVFGFTILFFGLNFLRESIPLVPQESGLIRDLSTYLADNAILSIIGFFAVGLILTIIFQSSSVTVALTFVLALEGWITYPMAGAMVLGENLGTTFTAIIASTVANRSGKRVALIHFLLNLIGVIWMMFMLTPALNLISWGMERWAFGNPYSDVTLIPVALSIFHTGFNILNVLILVFFIPKLVKLSNRVFPEVEDQEEIFRLTYIDSRFVSTSELSIVQARKEIAVMGERTLDAFNMIPELLLEKRTKEYHRLLQRIEKYEHIIDSMELEIATYLTKISEGKLSQRGMVQIRAMLKIIDELENIGDICFKMSRIIHNKNEQNLYFIQELRDNLFSMIKYSRSALENMVEQLKRGFNEVENKEAESIAGAINELRERLRFEHSRSLKEERYRYKTGIVYNDLLSLTERTGEYASGIVESMYQARKN
jgi:phosphate:Na+ symporter